MNQNQRPEEGGVAGEETELLARLETVYRVIDDLLKQREATLQGLKDLPKTLDRLAESAWLDGEVQRPAVDEWVEFGRDRRESLGRLAAELGGQISRDRAAFKVLEKARNGLRRAASPIALQELLGHSHLNRLTALYPPAGAVLEAVRKEIAEAYEETLGTYDRAFREACSQARPDWQIGGRFPSYEIAGRFAVSFDLHTRTVKLESSIVRSFQISTVVSRLQKYYKELWDGPFDPVKFLEELRTAYQRTVLIEGAAPGQELYLFRVHRELFAARQTNAFWRTNRGLRSYSEDAFAADLSRLLASGAAGNAVTLVPGRQPRHAYYVYDPGREDRVYYSLIKIVG